MKVHEPLDKLLNNEVKIKILRFLCNTGAEWSGRQITKEVKVSSAACHKALQELNSVRALLLRSAGRVHLHRLNEANFIALNLLKPLFERDAIIPDEVYKTVIGNISSSVIEDIISVAVFGSMKRREEHPTSDIDLLVVVKDEKNKKDVENAFDKVNEKILGEFGNVLSPHVQSIGEFKSKYKRGLALIKDILESHKLLFGEPLERLV
jgi:predicted nucleotidyltransferase